MCWQSLELFRGQEMAASAHAPCPHWTSARPCWLLSATAATHGANRFLKSVSGSGSSVTGEGKGDSLTAALGQDWDTGTGPGDVGHGTQDQGAQVCLESVSGPWVSITCQSDLTQAMPSVRGSWWSVVSETHTSLKIVSSHWDPHHQLLIRSLKQWQWRKDF